MPGRGWHIPHPVAAATLTRVSPRRRALLLLAAGLVLVAGGAVVLVSVPVGGVGFGWFEPVSGTTAPPRFYALRPAHLGATAVAVVGLVAASWAAGYLVGRRTT